jgi:hypothetical protein
VCELVSTLANLLNIVYKKTMQTSLSTTAMSTMYNSSSIISSGVHAAASRC